MPDVRPKLDLSAPARIHSLDQFRGYSVVAMFLVNFLGGLSATHQMLRHNNTHFSYADSIMPSFIFACGISFRISFLKQLSNKSGIDPYRRFIMRSFGLILLSMMLYGFNFHFHNWNDMSIDRLGRFVAESLKANLWEVLAIIGAVQIIGLPLVAKGFWVRVLAFLALGLIHFGLSWSFNYEFVYGKPNWMDAIWGTTGKRSWDGGLFGLLSWTQVLLAGTLAYDLMQVASTRKQITRLLLVGVGLMVLGYGLSCGTTLYDIEQPRDLDIQQTSQSPIFPQIRPSIDRSWTSFLAEPPFVPPPPITSRAWNYWMMDKRVVTQSFVFFSTGFSFFLFGLFVSACDLKGWKSKTLDMFGKNPLAAYIVHFWVVHSVLALVPKNSPMIWAIPWLCISFAITYLFVAFLEKRQLYLRI